MKKILLLSLFALSLIGATNIYAQKCETGKDPFTGEVTKIYKYKDNSLIFENKSGNITLTIVNGLDGERNVIIPEGSEVQIKLVNGDILKLKTINDAPPKSQVVGYAVITYYTYTFSVDQATLQKLADNMIVLYRFPTDNGSFFDWKVKGGRIAKYTKSIQKGAKCMLDQ